MYARFSVVSLGPGMRSKMEDLADHLEPVFRARPGFRSVSFLMDEAAGDYGSFSLWETREDAETASAAISPRVAELFQGMLTPWVFEVYEPGNQANSTAP
jgi:heme-degrading monooxygenase HmoA